MLTATRREWNELYVFFNLLAQGGIVLGNEEGLPSGRVLPIFQVTRQEHDGERRYTVEERPTSMSKGNRWTNVFRVKTSAQWRL